ncbi:HLH-domain-containing protein [Gigaspora margarita]|uniref:HLH-domain-containing protein n=2 Tax=Gigaspora margarita TaxID=4874 RepID=A0A8H3X6K3_GIGMA|nr:HLH-domain-containing protein [Gigaspora margarita]
MQFTSSFVFPPEAVAQTPVALNSDFTFTCQPGGAPLNSLSPLPLGLPPNVPLNMFSLDTTQATQATQVSQLLSPAPSSPLSILEYRDSPTADELDIPEFFQYSKEKYESQKMGCGRRRKSSRDEHFDNSSLDGDDIDDTSSTMSHAEFRRQIHIQSEQKRRAEIKDGFEELRRQLPTTYTGRKMSKAVLLQKAVSHLKNQSRKESFLLDEINRLSQTCVYLNAELEKEKRMSALYRQKQTLDKIYAIGL